MNRIVKTFSISLLRYFAVIFAVGMTAFAIFTSCSDDLFTDSITGNGSKEIRFKANLDSGAWLSRSGEITEEEPESRYVACIPMEGTIDGDSVYLHITETDWQVDDIPIEQLDSRSMMRQDMTYYKTLNVLASTFKGDWDEETCTPDYMYNAEFKRQSDGTYAEDNPHLWRTGYKTRFFAYSTPYRDKNASTLSITPPDHKGVPRIIYDGVNTSFENADLIVATSNDIDGEPAIAPELNFTHALTSVRLLTDGMTLMGTTDSICFNNFYNSAELPLDGRNEWTNHKQKDQYKYRYTVFDNYKMQQGVCSNLYPETYMIMAPQTLPDDATLELLYWEKFSEKKLKLVANIGGIKLNPGTNITCKLSTSRVEIIGCENSITFYNYNATKLGSSVTYVSAMAKSHVKAMVDGEEIYSPEEWWLEFVDENENVIDAPDWITVSPNKGSGKKGKDNGDSFSVRITPFEKDEDSHTANLKDAKSQTDCDLSMTNGQRTTANCYVVNAPGTYKLPLVYGNAVQNGADIAQTYANAVNYKNEQIKSAYIKDDAGAPSDAVLVWRDEQNLVQNVALSGDYLTFSVPQSTIHQGNAVVAVRDAEGTIMWSWHIWVTDFDPYGPEGYVRLSNGYNVMSRYLGWCDATPIKFTTRTARLRVRTKGYPTKNTYIISQNVFDNSLCNFPLYQWGRKDPCRIIYNGIDYKNSEKKLYFSESAYKFQNAKITESPIIYSKTIKQPYVFNFCNESNISIKFQYDIENTWSKNKNIYDPCPRGFKVPSLPSASFTERVIVEGQGFELEVTRPDKSTSKLFLPIAQIWNLYGNRTLYNSDQIYLWNYTTNDSSTAYASAIGKSTGTSTISKATMLPILPMVDE